jgi:uncharacterized RDD family membrane protein YckC
MTINLDALSSHKDLIGGFYEPAFSRRIGAFIIDLIIVRVIFHFLDDVNVDEADLAFGLFYLLVAIIAFVYVIAKDGFFNGQSIGKKSMNLAVVHYDDQSKRIGFIQAFQRGLIWLIPLSPLLIAAQVNGHPSHRRIGDGLAKTMVVDLTKKAKGPFVPRQEESFLGVKKRE